VAHNEISRMQGQIKMKTQIIFLILFLSSNLCLAAPSSVEEASELKKKFIKETGIELGNYELTKDSPPTCMDGPLEIVDNGTDLVLVLGAKPLAANLGRDKFSEKEDDCTRTYETSYNDVAIKERIERICDTDKTIFHTSITVSKGKISYVKEAYDGEKLVDTVKCTAIKKDTPKVEAPSETAIKPKNN
jgi:hypothetical protein